MIPAVKQYYLGVDGGGSTCRLRLIDGTGAVLAEARGAATNVSTALKTSLDELNAQWEALRRSSGIPARQVAAHFGLAGVLNDRIATRVARALPFRRVTVSDDRETTLIGTLSQSNGIVVAVGTGSFVGARIDGRSRILGGWGFNLGDQGSGAWMGRELLSRVLLLEDELTAPTPLLTAARAAFPTAADIVAGAGDPAQLATFAPQIMAAMEAGDPAARDIVETGAAYLANAVRALGYTPGTRLCAIGGLGPHYVPYLPDEMRADMTPADGTALDGAVALALRIPAETTA